MSLLRWDVWACTAAEVLLGNVKTPGGNVTDVIVQLGKP